MAIFIWTWVVSASLILAGHAFWAIILDKRLQFGIWTRIALSFFCILGPVGVLLEVMLLIQIFRDIFRQCSFLDETSIPKSLNRNERPSLVRSEQKKDLKESI
ncbi:MAG: hypothetical protein JRD88_11015 [Deltaproteobacteria bacterium]|jgi:hypothetical protein|nr:hypothetical protein [Deltaproteobacteria bacterium]